MTKRINRKLKNIVDWTFIALLAALVAVVAFTGIVKHVLVLGNSMEPTYSSGDLVLTVKTGDYELGDVIVFTPEPGHHNVVHRIVSGDEVSGYMTQGDNNDFVDPWVSNSHSILGEVILHIPVSSLGDSRDSLFVIFILVIGLGILVLFIKSKPKKEKDTV